MGPPQTRAVPILRGVPGRLCRSLTMRRAAGDDSGRLTAAERAEIDRAIARLHGHATLDAAFEEGHGEPQAVLKLASRRDAPGIDGVTVAG